MKPYDEIHDAINMLCTYPSELSQVLHALNDRIAELERRVSTKANAQLVTESVADLAAGLSELRRTKKNL